PGRPLRLRQHLAEVLIEAEKRFKAERLAAGFGPPLFFGSSRKQEMLGVADARSGCGLAGLLFPLSRFAQHIIFLPVAIPSDRARLTAAVRSVLWLSLFSDDRGRDENCLPAKSGLERSRPA